MKRLMRIALCISILAFLGACANGRGVSIHRGQTYTEQYFVDSIATSPGQGAEKPLTVYVEYDGNTKNTYIRGSIMIINDEMTACNTQIVVFADSFKKSGAKFSVGQTIVHSNGKTAQVGDQQIEGLLWDGRTLKHLKDKTSIEEVEK